MGQRGPIPDRSENLARDRSRKGGDQQDVTKGVARPATIPEADPDWHPIATMLWNAMLESGQSDFYQSTDWVMAYSLCEELSRFKEPHVNKSTGELYYKRSGQLLATINTMMGDLLLTEAHRRRVRIELEEPAPEETPLSVVAIDEYRKELGLE